MGEHRKEQEFGDTRRLEFLKATANAGVAVSHGELKLDVVIDCSEILGDSLGINAEGRTFVHPDFLIERSDLSWSGS